MWGYRGNLIEYVIDGQDRRVAKKVNGEITKRWLYADGLLPVAELDSAGNMDKRYVPGGVIKNDTTYRVIRDHLGSVRMIVNSETGEVVQRIDYDEYGNITYLQNQDEFTDIGFAGGLYDNHTGLVRFGARDYDPEVGRWTSKDPILFKGGASNLYEYALNDPINILDPDGLQWIYSQSTGDLFYQDRKTNDKEYITTGYSGHGRGVNNPELQHVENVGPIPRGKWKIGPQYDSQTTGPASMKLKPMEGTDPLGRDLFRIHGDNSELNQTASMGCPIFPRSVRDSIDNSNDKVFKVIK